MTSTARNTHSLSSTRPQPGTFTPKTACPPRLRPRPSRVLVFPGQGSQSVGMGRDLAESYLAARAVFNEVDDALGVPLSRLLFEGPFEALTLTENAQPALMAMGVAIARVLRDEFDIEVANIADFVAGHSLGEYTALVVAGSLSLADGARLLRKRGLAMKNAVADGDGAMASLIGIDLADAQAIAKTAAEQCHEGAVCGVAGDNAPGQVVIAGTRATIDRAIRIAEQRGVRRVVPLSVSRPFHCALMQPAADELASALDSIQIDRPVVPLISNVTAQETRSPDQIRKLLVRQVTSMVRWRESCLYLKSRGVHEFLEMGPGTVLSGLAKRIDRQMACTSLGTANAIEAFADSIS